MMTLMIGALIVYACRRPLIWIGLRAAAFTVGFIIGWRFMERR